MMNHEWSVNASKHQDLLPGVIGHLCSTQIQNGQVRKCSPSWRLVPAHRWRGRGCRSSQDLGSWRKDIQHMGRDERDHHLAVFWKLTNKYNTLVTQKCHHFILHIIMNFHRVLFFFLGHSHSVHHWEWYAQGKKICKQEQQDNHLSKIVCFDN